MKRLREIAVLLFSLVLVSQAGAVGVSVTISEPEDDDYIEKGTTVTVKGNYTLDVEEDADDGYKLYLDVCAEEEPVDSQDATRPGGSFSLNWEADEEGVFFLTVELTKPGCPSGSETIKVTVTECNIEIADPDAPIHVCEDDELFVCHDAGSATIDLDEDESHCPDGLEGVEWTVGDLDGSGESFSFDPQDLEPDGYTVRAECTNKDDCSNDSDERQLHVVKIMIDGGKKDEDTDPPEESDPLYVCRDDEETEEISLTEESYFEEINWNLDGLDGEISENERYFEFVPNEQEAGEYTVTATCPETDSSDERDVYVVNVEIVQPVGDPRDPEEADEHNQIVFNTETPGILTLQCIAEDSGLDNDYLCWWVTPNYDIEAHWEPPLFGNDHAGGSTTEAVATWEGLPYPNFGFGEWDLKLYYKEGPLEPTICKEESKIQVFFPRDATNNPIGEYPNWYYYWRDGNVVDRIEDFEYVDDDFYGEYSQFWNELRLGNLAPTERSSFPVQHQYDPDKIEWVNANAEGIYCTATIIAHERTHKWIRHDGPWKDLPDMDGDNVPDEIEGTLGYDLREDDPDTYDIDSEFDRDYSGYGDEEFLARKVERGEVDDVPIEVEDVHPEKDWSDTGVNYHE